MGCTAARSADSVTAWAATLAVHPEGTRATAIARPTPRILRHRRETFRRMPETPMLCRPASTAAPAGTRAMGACVATATAVARNVAVAMAVVARAGAPEAVALVAAVRLAV